MSCVGSFPEPGRLAGGLLIWLSGFTQVTLLLFVSIDHPSHRLGRRFNSIIDVIRVDVIRTI